MCRRVQFTLESTSWAEPLGYLGEGGGETVMVTSVCVVRRMS